MPTEPVPAGHVQTGPAPTGPVRRPSGQFPRAGAQPGGPRRRLVIVVARHAAVAPGGVDPDRFARAALADTYEVAAGLVEVEATIAGAASCSELLYPGSTLLPPDADLAELAAAATAAGYDEVVQLPADAPDLPGLVVAKVFKALQRAAVCVAPERTGRGCVAVGLALPVADWVTLPADLDTDPTPMLRAAAPRRSWVGTAPDWYRLRRPDDVRRLDPALEGWDETRLLLDLVGP
jgi:hypothetical protein